MKPICAGAILLLASACAARNVPSARGAVEAITETSVRSHMEFLAGDAMNGRAGGTRDEWVTATYIASHLRRWGLEPLGDNGGYTPADEIRFIDFPHMTAAIRSMMAPIRWLADSAFKPEWLPGKKP